ncbi:MAG: LysE family transporter [Acinetobacter sp.]|nr:LysE family transporter [Acinetobacter sp.]
MNTFLTIALLHFMAQLSPGPDILLTSKIAISQGRIAAFWCALGISLGIAIWIAITLTGFSVILQQWQGVQTAITLFGAIFLAKMGFAMLKSAWTSSQQISTQQSIQPTKQSALQLLSLGLMTNLSNPKVLIYFASVFSLAIQDTHLHQTKLLLGTILTLETWIVFSTLAYIFSLAKVQHYYQAATRWIDSIAGGLFLLFSMLLLWDIAQTWL